MNLLARSKLGAQAAADGPANRLQCANTFTGHPPTGDEIHACAHTIRLDYGGLYGNDLDDWLRAEREMAATRRQRASAKDRYP